MFWSIVPARGQILTHLDNPRSARLLCLGQHSVCKVIVSLLKLVAEHHGQNVLCLHASAQYLLTLLKLNFSLELQVWHQQLSLAVIAVMFDKCLAALTSSIHLVS